MTESVLGISTIILFNEILTKGIACVRNIIDDMCPNNKRKKICFFFGNTTTIICARVKQGPVSFVKKRKLYFFTRQNK